MSPRHLALRRLLTAAGVIGVLVLGYGSIRAASAWTSASAPLAVAPVTVASLQAALTEEQARSAILTEQLRDLDAQSRDLEAALAQARTRVEADTGHAGDLEAQLDAAGKQLAKLESAIAKAKKALAAQVAAASRRAAADPPSAPTAGARHDEDDDEDHEDEDDEDERDDDD